MYAYGKGANGFVSKPTRFIEMRKKMFGYFLDLVAAEDV